MVDIAITIQEDVTAAMNRLAADGTDMTPAMKDIAGHLADTTRERFETETDPTGRKWIPSRRVVEHGGKTLTLTGNLGNSITEDWGPDFAAAGPERSGGAGIGLAGMAAEPGNRRRASADAAGHRAADRAGGAA